MCKKTVDNYPHALEFVPSTIKFVLVCFITQQMCDKAVNRCCLYLILFLIEIKLNRCVTELFLEIFF